MYKGLVSDAILWGYGVYCRVTTPIPYLDSQFDTFQCESRARAKYKDLDAKDALRRVGYSRVMILFPTLIYSLILYNVNLASSESIKT